MYGYMCIKAFKQKVAKAIDKMLWDCIVPKSTGIDFIYKIPEKPRMHV